MTGVSNLKQVLSSTPAVERLQEIQERAEQAGQQQAVRHLKDEAEKETHTVSDRAEVRRPEPDDRQKEEEKRERRAKQPAEKAGGAEDTASEATARPDADDEEGKHVDIVA
jgi:hypothetical protein